MIEMIDCEQGTDAWKNARLGIVTASEFSKVLAKGEGKTRAAYMRQLVGERLTGRPADTGFYGNKDTERGKEMEPEARELLELRTGQPVTQVGFIVNHDLRMGCSPDGLQGFTLGDNLVEALANASGVELKCPLPHVQIERLMRGGLPSEYAAQVEGCLLVTGAKSWKFYSYSTGLPAHIFDVTLPEIRAAFLRAELSNFNAELDIMAATVRRMY